MGRIRTTTPTWDRARRPIDEFRARAEPLPVIQLEGGGGSSMLRTPNPLPASPEWFTVPINSLIGRDDDALGEVGTVVLGEQSVAARKTAEIASMAAPKQSLLARFDADLSFKQSSSDSVFARFGGIADMGFQQAVARRVLARGSSGDLEWKSPAKFLAEVMDLATTGTSFPTTNLYDGRPFYRTDLHASFHHDTSTTGWLGDEVLTLHGGENVNEAGYLDLLPYNAPYNGNTKGWEYPFDVKPVWMSGRVLGVSTCTIVIRDNGTNVTSAVLAWSAANGFRSAEILGGTISTPNNISFAVDTGTAIAGGAPIGVHAGFRRFAT